jgi:argininosuccinate lyase
MLKEPLMRGLDRTEVMLAALGGAVPLLGVNTRRCAEALDAGALATDEVMRRVEAGQAFRAAYRDVKRELGRGRGFEAPSPARLIARRRSTGGLGDLGLADVRRRLRAARGWNRRERRRFDQAMRRLAGRGSAR